MGLDVYVGSLTRYYSGDWETIVQQVGREQGMPVMIVRPDGLEAERREHAGPLGWLLRRLGRPGRPETEQNAARRREALRRRIDAWQTDLSHELADRLDAPLNWDESDTAPYFSDKPGWDGHLGVGLLAAYTEHPELPRPERILDDPQSDAAWLAATAPGCDTRYGQILKPELWLPYRADVVVSATDPFDEERCIGSSHALVAQLRELNQATFHGTAADLAHWRQEGLGEQRTVDDAARFGLAVLLDLAERSVTHHLPMKLDY